jgi:hypothetical protein
MAINVVSGAGAAFGAIECAPASFRLRLLSGGEHVLSRRRHEASPDQFDHLFDREAVVRGAHRQR